MTRAIWTKARGKLGFLTPLLGQWRHEGGEGEEHFDCVRHFEKVLGGDYVRVSLRTQGSGPLS